MNDISLLMYTNQEYLDIAKLTMSEFIKNSKNINIEKYIVSNSFKDITIFEDIEVKLIDSMVPFDSRGSHFSQTIVNALEQIDSEYILLLLDDMCVFTPIKENTFNGLLRMIKDESIDYFSTTAYDYNWPLLQINYNNYGLPENSLMMINPSWQYLYSTQPCIWKKNSLLLLLKNNLDISVNYLDTTNIKNLKGVYRDRTEHGFWETDNNFWDYGFKNVCLSLNSLTGRFAFDEHNGEDDYFLFLYSEILRFGKFNIHSHNNNRIFLEKFLPKNNINKEDIRYGKFFSN